MVALILALALPASALAAFGVTSFTAEAINQNGTLDTQAGSHPFEATTSFIFNQAAGAKYDGDGAGNVKDVELELPPGFIGNPDATPQCSESQLMSENCPADTQVGVVTVTFGGHLAGPDRQPVYNLVPPSGHPAAFGFRAAPTGAVASQLLASVNPATGDRLVVRASDIPTGTGNDGVLPTVAVNFTFWGMPADPAHNAERGRQCDEEATVGYEPGCEAGNSGSDAPLTPFLTNPTSCASGPLTTTLRVDSWQNPGRYLTYAAESPQPTGCGALSFHPSLVVEPDATQADTPTGMTFRVKVPQDPNVYGLGTSALEAALVTLPRGVSIDPSAASGLAGCTNEEIGIGTEQPVTCPAASKLGTVEVFTPLLANEPDGSAPLKGSIYLGTPIPGEEYRIFLAIEGHGVSIRLDGRVSADPTTGQLAATFAENPPLPFSELVLRFFSGARAALASPVSCGPATTTSDLTPYGAPEIPDATPASSFSPTGCASPAPFSPNMSAGTTSRQAGSYSSFTLQLSRSDGQQYLSQLAPVSLPPGLVGNISSAPLCGAGEAAADTCGPLSEIGTVTVGAGPGPEPFYLGGRVYLTEGYDGDPFGLSIVVPAIAGPYNLGTVVVRAGVKVNNNGSVTVHADPVPTILEGIPLRLRYIGVTLDRPSFMVNPTNCGQQTITATALAQQGASASLTSGYFATGCARLPFNPVLLATTEGNASAAENGHGASLAVRIMQSSGEADIRAVHVDLPKALPARLKTLNKACTEAQFASDPAGCPAASKVGTAVAHTPFLPVPLQGPAIFVSHGGAAFPDLVLVLQGDGVTINLTGETFIAEKTGITSSTFKSVPDVPIGGFELDLPEASNSALAAAHGSLCDSRLNMPTTIEAQNGRLIKQTTNIDVTGCKAKPPSRPQKLASAVKACKKNETGDRRSACDAGEEELRNESQCHQEQEGQLIMRTAQKFVRPFAGWTKRDADSLRWRSGHKLYSGAELRKARRLDAGLRGVKFTVGLALGVAMLGWARANPALGMQAPACPNEQVRHESSINPATGQPYSTELPECRAYELVTPGSHNAQGNTLGLTGQAVAPDGSVAVIQSMTELPGSPVGGEGWDIATRGPDGWEMTPLEPPTDDPDNVRTQATGAVGEGFATVFLGDDNDLLAGDADANIDDVFAVSTGGLQAWISQGPSGGVGVAPAPNVGNNEELVDIVGGATPGLSRVVFQTPFGALIPRDTHAYGGEIYDRLGENRTELVGILPDESVPMCGASLGEQTNGGVGYGGSVSQAGTTVFFESPDPISKTTSVQRPGLEACPVGAWMPPQLYARVNDTETVKASAPAAGVADPNGEQESRYQAATPEGGDVLFTSKGELTQNANTDGDTAEDLYEYEVGTHRLTDVSSEGLTDSHGSAVQGVLGASENGRVVYFVAQGKLTTDATSGNDNVYVSDAGQLSYIADLSSSDRADWEGVSQGRTTRLTPDGSDLLFSSTESLTGYDNAGRAELFVYALGVPGLACVSCGAPGTAATGAATLGGAGNPAFAPSANITPDGSFVLFDSEDALTPDTTAGVDAVYEWQDGILSLIAPGGPTGASLVGASTDGSNVFFKTSQALTAQDQTGGEVEIYDARVNGGFPSPPTPPKQCESIAECRSETTTLSAPTIASLTPGAVGNVAPPKAAPPDAKVAITKHTTKSVSVKVSGKGMVSLAGAGLRAVRLSVRTAGTYNLKLSLTAHEKALLIKRKRVAIRVRVEFVPASGKSAVASVAFTLEGP